MGGVIHTKKPISLREQELNKNLRTDIVLTFLLSCLFFPTTFSVHAQSSPRSESLQARGCSWYAP